MRKKLLALLILLSALSAAYYYLNYMRITPEEQLMREMGDILKEAYGRDTRVDLKKLK